MSKCGKIARICEESSEKAFIAAFEEFPGGPDTFLIAVKFCYGLRVELTPRNIVIVYCAADYLQMTDEYGEDNLLSKSENFFHKNALHNWKDCILALQSSNPVIARAEKLQIISKCLSALSMMVCTDPGLFGWPMMMYGSLQSPGGSILWNGINTGARIQSVESDWWFEDISYLSVGLFERLINTMETRGIRPEILVGAIMYYARKYLPGLGRWQSGQSRKTRTFASFSLTPAVVDQKVLIETIEKLIPEKKGKSFCRFLLGLLRVALILGVNQMCKDSLERRVGMQLEVATLDSLLIPAYSDSDTLYNVDCVERIIHHFMASESRITLFSPSSLDPETSPSSEPLRKVAKLIDNYIAEVASDIHLKPRKIRSLAEALPESSRPLHDGLYRALDIYFKVWNYWIFFCNTTFLYVSKIFWSLVAFSRHTLGYQRKRRKNFATPLTTRSSPLMPVPMLPRMQGYHLELLFKCCSLSRYNWELHLLAVYMSWTLKVPLQVPFLVICWARLYRGMGGEQLCKWTSF